MIRKIKKFAKHFDYKMSYDNDKLYLKLFYDERPDQEYLNNLYVEAMDLFINDDYDFKGMTEYQDNKELCFVYGAKKY